MLHGVDTSSSLSIGWPLALLPSLRAHQPRPILLFHCNGSLEEHPPCPKYWSQKLIFGIYFSWCLYVVCTLDLWLFQVLFIPQLLRLLPSCSSSLLLARGWPLPFFPHEGGQSSQFCPWPIPLYNPPFFKFTCSYKCWRTQQEGPCWPAEKCLTVPHRHPMAPVFLSTGKVLVAASSPSAEIWPFL